ncbi:hypothetical protein KFL_013390010, partial [Klebsormidium nitens]
DCQAQHWKVGHKRECKLAAAELAVVEGRWKQAEDLCAHVLKTTLPKMEAGPAKQKLQVRVLKCRCRVRMRSDDFSGAVEDARAAFEESGKTDGRAKERTGGGTKCEIDLPTASLINHHLRESTRLDPSLADERKAAARMVAENLYVLPSTSDENANKDVIRTRLERDRRRLAQLKLPSCPGRDILEYHMAVFADQRDGSELAGAEGQNTLQILKIRTLQAKAVVLHVINKVDVLDGCRRLKEELLRIERAPGWLSGERLVVQNVISLQQDVKRLAKKLKGLPLDVEQGREVKALEKRVGSSLLGALQEAMTIVLGKGVLERLRLMDVMGP